MVDALASDASALRGVEVQVLSRVPGTEFIFQPLTACYKPARYE